MNISEMNIIIVFLPFSLNFSINSHVSIWYISSPKCSILNICCFKQDLDRNNVWWVESGSMNLWGFNRMYVPKVTSWPPFFFFLHVVERAKKRLAPEWMYSRNRESLSFSLQPRAEILHATNCYYCLWWGKSEALLPTSNYPSPLPR